MNKVIDISQWQGRISDSQWADIKKKVNGVIIRVGYRGYGTGELRLDDEFTFNLNACKKRGIPYGFYFFTQAVNAAEAQEEVSLIAKVADIRAAELGVWCDTETSNNGKGRADVIGPAERTTGSLQGHPAPSTPVRCDNSPAGLDKAIRCGHIQGAAGNRIWPYSGHQILQGYRGNRMGICSSACCGLSGPAGYH